GFAREGRGNRGGISAMGLGWLPGGRGRSGRDPDRRRSPWTAPLSSLPRGQPACPRTKSYPPALAGNQDAGRGGRACWAAWQRLCSAAMSTVTQILSAIEQGDPQAADQLLPLVYDELRKLAVQKLAQEKPGQTLQA